MINKSLLGILGLFLFKMTLLMASEPLAVYLVCQRTPHEAMTIQWITSLSENKGSILFKGNHEPLWQMADSQFHPLPNQIPYGVHRIELVSLSPNSEYSFRIGNDAKEYKFLTLPDKLTEPLTFIEGGDIYHDGVEVYEKMNRRAASQNPRFVLWGGDLAYASNRYFLSWEKSDRWLDLMSVWSKTMVTSNGHLIPLITVIGNHEVTGSFGQLPAKAPFFYTLFPTPGYQVIDIGNYLSLFLLDSGHTHPVEGKQTDWLKTVLSERKDIPFKFACYHVPAFPCVRSHKNKHSVTVRKYWPSLFEEFHLLAAFEHHDHAYKRTYLIKEGKISPDGVLYLGDGGWGVEKIRKPRTPANSWYLAKTAKQRHFIRVTLTPDKKTRYQAMNAEGAIFDEYVQSSL